MFFFEGFPGEAPSLAAHQGRRQATEEMSTATSSMRTDVVGGVGQTCRGTTATSSRAPQMSTAGTAVASPKIGSSGTAIIERIPLSSYVLELIEDSFGVYAGDATQQHLDSILGSTAGMPSIYYLDELGTTAEPKKNNMDKEVQGSVTEPKEGGTAGSKKNNKEAQDDVADPKESRTAGLKKNNSASQVGVAAPKLGGIADEVVEPAALKTINAAKEGVANTVPEAEPVGASTCCCGCQKE